MKTIAFSISENMNTEKLVSAMDHLKVLSHKGVRTSDAYIAILCEEVNSAYYKDIKRLIDYLEKDMDMILHVYFFKKNLSASVIDLVQNCESFIFREETKIRKSESQDGFSVQGLKLNKGLSVEESIKSVKEVRLIGLEGCIRRDFREMIREDFLDQAWDHMGYGEVFGDHEAFEAAFDMKQKMQTKEPEEQEKMLLQLLG